MTPERLAELRALEQAATPGPWEVNYEGGSAVHGIRQVGASYGDEIIETDCGYYGPKKPDADFIAAARTAVPELLEEVEAARRAGEVRHKVVKALTAERDALRAERDRLTAEVEMLRGVGCMEDGDGPCGACRKCARAEAERLRAALNRLVEAAERTVRGVVMDHDTPSVLLVTAIAAARAALATRGETP